MHTLSFQNKSYFQQKMQVKLTFNKDTWTKALKRTAHQLDLQIGQQNTLIVCFFYRRIPLKYASPLWAGLTVDNAKQLEGVQYKATRLARGALKHLVDTGRQEVQIDTLTETRDAADLYKARFK